MQKKKFIKIRAKILFASILMIFFAYISDDLKKKNVLKKTASNFFDKILSIFWDKNLKMATLEGRGGRMGGREGVVCMSSTRNKPSLILRGVQHQAT